MQFFRRFFLTLDLNCDLLRLKYLFRSRIKDIFELFLITRILRQMTFSKDVKCIKVPLLLLNRSPDPMLTVQLTVHWRSNYLAPMALLAL